MRFHSLPDAKRYAEVDAERSAVLDRHRTLLEELFEGAELEMLFLTWDGAELSEMLPSGTKTPREWRRNWPVDDKVLFHASVCSVDAFPSAILERVADDQLRNVVLFAPPIAVLYHPYDGGADVIARDSEHRADLAERFKAWRPENAHGL